jgi:hypothetical protein
MRALLREFSFDREDWAAFGTCGLMFCAAVALLVGFGGL